MHVSGFTIGVAIFAAVFGVLVWALVRGGSASKDDIDSDSSI